MGLLFLYRQVHSPAFQPSASNGNDFAAASLAAISVGVQNA